MHVSPRGRGGCSKDRSGHNCRGGSRGQNRCIIAIEGRRHKDLRRRAGLTGNDNFRFHDLRHDGATKILRTTGNLKLTAKLLDHADTATVSKTYAHIMRQDTAEALSDLAAARKDVAQNPRDRPRSGKLKAV